MTTNDAPTHARELEAPEEPGFSASSALGVLAARWCAGQSTPKATLYVVATPIGNVADITLRAVHVLNMVDVVACEDTRTTAPLLERLGIRRPMMPLHEHIEREAADRVVARLALGERVALVSDAGTPLVSDPGARLVDAVRLAGYAVVPLPGASALTVALSAAGTISADGSVRFVGFLPAKGKPRSHALAAALATDEAVVLYEAPHRIEDLAQLLGLAAPTRRVTFARELTKRFETIVSLEASQAAAWLAADRDRCRGEFVVIVHAATRAVAADDDHQAGAGDAARVSMLDPWLRALLASMPLKQAVAVAVQATGSPRNEVYARALQVKAQGADRRREDGDEDDESSR